MLINNYVTYDQPAKHIWCRYQGLRASHVKPQGLLVLDNVGRTDGLGCFDVGAGEVYENSIAVVAKFSD